MDNTVNAPMAHELDHDLKHDIVCRNVSILCTCVGHEMKTMLALLIFNLYTRKNIFIFRELKLLFCEADTVSAISNCKHRRSPQYYGSQAF
jgi:hypothetical protein